MLVKSKYWKITQDVILPLTLLVLIAASIYTVFYSPVFAISEVTCIADWEPCKNENVIVEVNRVRGSNLFLFNEASLITRLKSSNFMLKEVRIDKHLPSNITVTAISVNPSSAIIIPGTDHPTFIVCDEEGRVIRVTGVDPNVPTVTVSTVDGIRVGQIVPDPSLVRALEFARVIRDSNLSYTNLTLVDPMTLSLKLKSGATALFTPDKDVAEQVRALQLIVSDSTIKKEPYDTIDVRFKEAVIRKN